MTDKNENNKYAERYGVFVYNTYKLCHKMHPLSQVVWLHYTTKGAVGMTDIYLHLRQEVVLLCQIIYYMR